MFKFNPEKELKKIQHGSRNKYIVIAFVLLVIAVIGYSHAFYQVRYSKRIIYTKVKIPSFAITTSIQNGSVEPSEQTVKKGKDSTSFTITPNNGYEVEAVSCSNNQSITRSGNTFKVTKVTNNSECIVTLTKKGLQLNEYLANLVESDITSDGNNNKRYYGPNATVKNYIWFNCDTYSGLTKDNASQHCEKWRIIGLMNNVETESKGKQNLVKIIRKEPLPNYYVFDNKPSGKGSSDSSLGSNDWTDSRLMMLLNPGYSSHELNASGATGSLYWDRKDGKCSGATSDGATVSDGGTIDCKFSTEGLKGDNTGPTKSMIETVKWKLGGLSSTSSAENYYQNATAVTSYKYERDTNVYTGRKTYWIGKIGLMYPSDYGYATGGKGSGIGTYTRDQCLNYKLYGWNSGDYKKDCAGNDWLYDSSKGQVTLTPASSHTWNSFRVGTSGTVSTDNPRNTRAVRPSLYLTSNTMISSGEGDGSSGNPYIIVA